MEIKRNAQVLRANLALEGQTILDVGSGEGHLTRMMTKQGATVIGLECSPRQLEKAKSYPKVGTETFLSGVGEHPPFPEQSFDSVVYFNSLHHVPVELQKTALKEAVRVLKKDGLLYISEPIAEGPHFELLKPIDDETYVRAEAYKVIQGYEEFGLTWEREEIYNHPVRRKSFEELRDKLTGPNPERDEIFKIRDKELRTAFTQLGTEKEDGYTYFDQPTRMNLLRK